MRWGALRLLATLALVSVCAGNVQATEKLRGATLVSGEVTSGEKRTLTVGAEGARLKLAEDTYIVASPGTQLRMGRGLKLSLGTGANSRIPSRVVTLVSGELDVLVPKTEPMSFAVLVVEPGKGRVRAICRGGHCVIHAKEGLLRCAALAHNMLFSTGNGWRQIKEGEYRTFTRWRPLGSVHKLPARVEELRASKHLLTRARAQAAQAQLSWQGRPEAANYEVKVTGEQGRSVFRSTTLALQHSLRGLTAGRYFAKVRGLTKSGVGGEWSSPVELNVVSLEVAGLPAMTSLGVIRLLPEQRVELTGAEGLEIAYVGVDSFIPAPKSLGLIGRRPILVELRHPASGETLRLDLVPMDVRAQVNIARAPSSWPRLGLPVVVELVDDGGRPVPESFDVSIRVSVNLQPSVTAWQKESGRLNTRLPRPSGKGPWIVRLEIYDATGALIGRDVRDIGYRTAGRLAITK